jgi:subtilisin family serine protease
MKSIVLLLLLAVVGILAKAPLLKLSDPSTHIPGSYIIVLHANITEEIRDKHITQLSAKFQPGHRVSHRYHIGDFIGFAAEISDDLVEYELNHPDVEYIEHDGVVSIDQGCTVQPGAVWSLDRIAERQLSALDGNYDYPSSGGTGVFAYIIDTGIYLQHTDFAQGRATWGTNTVDSNNADCNGHGTHVASTTGGVRWGVAKNVRLISVKVLNCAGSGSNAGVIAGVDWSARDFAARGTSARGVANMSLGGARSTASNQAVENAVAAGLQFAIAAGNSNTDACNSSPASATTSVTVAATALVGSGSGQIDQRSSFSNYGPCVHIYAPGSTITAAWIGSTTAQNTISGTSMASPHVCGVLALIAGNAASRLTSAQLKSQVLSQSTANVVTQNCGSNSICNSTPNRFVYNGC